MGNSKFLFVLTIIFFVFGDVSAKEFQEEQIISLKTVDSIEIGLQNYWYKYEEEVDGAFFMSNTGYKYGLSLTGTKNIGNDNYMMADVRFAIGDVEYESASGKGDVSDNMYDVRLAIGTETIADGNLLSSYIGLGYRRLNNDLRDLGSGGYRRESEYLYVPIGVVHRFRVSKTARFSTTVEYDYFLKGEQKSYLSDISPAYAAVFGDPINKQNHGYGVRISTTYEQESWSAGLFFNYWNIDDSEKNYYTDGFFVYSIMEPENDTKELGLQVKYRF